MRVWRVPSSSSIFVVSVVVVSQAVLFLAPLGPTMPVSLLTWALLPFVLTLDSVCGPLWP
ncbi:hypothetical protein A2U01_0107389, partial [Trifolium medium]|nr:hypothetical protein [Trifolium medium]